MPGVTAASRVFQVCTRTLKEYRWIETDYSHPERPVAINLQIEFLEKQEHEIQEWLFVAPQRRSSVGSPLELGSAGTFAVKQRHRVEERGFGVYGEVAHRMIAEYLTDLENEDKKGLAHPNNDTVGLQNHRRGIIMLYQYAKQKQTRFR
jgi:hypothetical protein